MRARRRRRRRHMMPRRRRKGRARADSLLASLLLEPGNAGARTTKARVHGVESPRGLPSQAVPQIPRTKCPGAPDGRWVCFWRERATEAGGETERRLWPTVHLAVNVVFLVRLTSRTRAHIPPVDRMCAPASNCANVESLDATSPLHLWPVLSSTVQTPRFQPHVPRTSFPAASISSWPFRLHSKLCLCLCLPCPRHQRSLPPPLSNFWPLHQRLSFPGNLTRSRPLPPQRRRLSAFQFPWAHQRHSWVDLLF